MTKISRRELIARTTAPLWEPHTAKLWKPGEAPRLVQKIVEGLPPLATK